MISPSICTSVSISQLSKDAEILFYRLLMTTDEFGTFRADPKIVLCACMPMRIETITTSEISIWLCELQNSGVISLFFSDGDLFGTYKNFDAHNQFRKARKRRYPKPSKIKVMTTESIMAPLQYGIDTVSTPYDDGTATEKVFDKRREEKIKTKKKRREEKRKTCAASPCRPASPDLFPESKEPGDIAEQHRRLILAFDSNNLVGRDKNWPVTKSAWEKIYRIMHEQDDRPWDEILEALAWIFHDSPEWKDGGGWRVVCQNARAVRKHYDRIRGQMKSNGGRERLITDPDDPEWDVDMGF